MRKKIKIGGQYDITSLALSEDGKYAAICYQTEVKQNYEDSLDSNSSSDEFLEHLENDMMHTLEDLHNLYVHNTISVITIYDIEKDAILIEFTVNNKVKNIALGDNLVLIIESGDSEQIMTMAFFDRSLLNNKQIKILESLSKLNIFNPTKNNKKHINFISSESYKNIEDLSTEEKQKLCRFMILKTCSDRCSWPSL